MFLSASMLVIFVFAGMLSYSSLFGRETKAGGGFLIALRSFPVKAEVIFIAKLVFNFSILIFIQVLLVVLYMIFFQLSFNSPIWLVSIVIILATLNYSIIGTLVASLSVYSRAKMLIVPLLMFPLILPPIAISSLELYLLILGELSSAFYQNFAILTLHSLIILTISLLVIETLIKG